MFSLFLTVLISGQPVTNTIDNVIPMSSGNTPIDQALKEI